MALFDFLKRKKEVEKAKKPAKVSAVKEKKSEKIEPIAQPASKQNKNRGFSYETIKNPHISEKATYLGEKDQYIFKVSPKSGGYPNKREVKDAIEGIYKVDVLSVNIVKIPSKKRRLGRIEGLRKAYRKAIVKIKEGQKIEIL
jgi:large subunit ribosomal protein L23